MAVGDTPISGLPQAGALTGAELVPVVSNGVTSQVTVGSLRGGTVTKGVVLVDSDWTVDLGDLSTPGIYSIAAEVAAGQTVAPEAAYFRLLVMQDSLASPTAISDSLANSFQLLYRAQRFQIFNTSLVPLTFNYVITSQVF